MTRRKAICPGCGHPYTVNRDGTIRLHRSGKARCVGSRAEV